MIGERGGSTATFDEAQDLIEAQKAHWREAIRTDILETLAVADSWHADDLLPLGVPADCKNVIGAAVGALVNRGLIEETGERRKSAAPESHGRKSNVYRLTDKGRQKLRHVSQVCHGEEVGVDNHQLGGPETGSRADSSDKGTASPCRSVAVDSGRPEPQGGGEQTRQPAAALPTLFEVADGPGHIDLDQRAA